jgi:hypothetical protein
MALAEDDAVALIQAHFDESAGDGLLVMAGYIFIKSKAIQFDRDWGRMLREFKLPYFHMIDCAHGAPPFDILSRDERIRAGTAAIKLIRKYAAQGYSASIDIEEFKSVGGKDVVKTAYDLLLWFCLVAVKGWANRRSHSGSIGYFFEAGHASQSSANNMLQRIFKDAELKEQYRYSGHAFLEKARSFPCQAADVLAWQVLQDEKRKRWPIYRPRGDFRALVENKEHYHLRLWGEGLNRALRDAGGGEPSLRLLNLPLSVLSEVRHNA